MSSQPMAVPLRVLVADDHPIVRDGLCALLNAADDIHLAGQAATGAEAVTLAGLLDPHVVLMDLRMPDCDGLQATRAIRATNPAVRIVMLTMIDDDDSLFAAMRAGAHGYLLKEATADEVLRAVRAAADGDAIFGPGVAQRILDHLTGNQPCLASAPFPSLTSGERAVLDLLAAGHNNATIAARLTLSPKTIRNRVSSIFDKLQVATRPEAIVKARSAGLGGPLAVTPRARGLSEDQTVRPPRTA